MKTAIRVLGVFATVKLAFLLPALFLPALFLPKEASAHASQQAFVLLLPTDIYATAGVAVVALTVLALFAVPGRMIRGVFRAAKFRGVDWETLRTITSLIALVLLILMLHIGLSGPRDPLSNLMPLAFWTGGWIGLVVLAGLLGDIWRWINPWTGLYRLLGKIRPSLSFPENLGAWPAVCLLVGFTAFLLADIAPDDPARLAYLVGGYWLMTMAGLILCGPAWLQQVEFGSVLMSCYGDLAPVRARSNGGIGCPGWRLLERTPVRAGGVFALTLLAVGSFDGLNETFWWLARIGVNPLAFPGRSAVVWPTLLGLIGAIAGLVAMVALTVWLGLMLTGKIVRFANIFDRLAFSMLPIALVYHVAHYLPTFLVNIQHSVAAMSDPFAQGADLLGIQPFYVTTGFFNHLDTVRLIWLTQAGVVVIGHVWSVFLAHRIALDHFPDHRRAAVATLPLSLFMIGYTMLGLWLLATPRGA